jgi:chromosome segregation ATPase
MGTPLERQFAEALGIENQDQWLRLPLEVGSCSQGSQCCWRWLARAALEQVATEPIRHLSMPDAVARLCEEKQELANLRAWSDEAQDQINQGFFHKQELDACRISCYNGEEEIKELRSRLADDVKLRREIDELREDNTQLKAHEQQLQKEVTNLTSQRRVLIEGDLAAAKARADQAEQELTKSFETKLEQRYLAEDLGRRLNTAQAEIDRLRDQVAQLQKVPAKRPRLRIRKRKEAKAAAGSHRYMQPRSLP